MGLAHRERIQLCRSDEELLTQCRYWHLSDLMLALADVCSSGKADIAQERAKDRF
jgi:hypothetical protein